MSELGNHESGVSAMVEPVVYLPGDLDQVFKEMDTIRAEKSPDDSGTPEQKLDLSLKALGVLVKHVEDSHLNLDEAIEAMKQNVAAQQEAKGNASSDNSDTEEHASEAREPVLLGSLNREQRNKVKQIARRRTQPPVRPSAPLALSPDLDKAEKPSEMPVVTNVQVAQSPNSITEAGGLLGKEDNSVEQSAKEESKEERKKKLVKVVGAVSLMLGAALGRGESSAAAHESTLVASPALRTLHQDEEHSSTVDSTGSLYTLGDETGSANSLTVTPVEVPPTETPAPEGVLASEDEAQSVGTSNTVDVGDSSMATPNMPVDSGATPAGDKAHQEPTKESGWKSFFGFGGKGDNATKS